MALSFKSEVKVELELLENGDLKIRFNNAAMEDLIVRRSGVQREELGGEARQLLAASLLECLCSTFIHLLDWVRVNPKMFRAEAEVISGKDESGRVCIDSINVKINVAVPEDEETLRRLKRAEILLERGCLISRSLIRGIKVNYSISTEI